MKFGEFKTFSEQELVDCAYGAVASDGVKLEGCTGGDPIGGLEYVKNHGVYSDYLYPFEAQVV
jgi:hypothetical protein